MCFALYGCCGPPPHATAKAYLSSGGYGLEWHDKRDEFENRESAVCIWPSGSATDAIAAFGSGDGSSTREGAVLVRDATDGSRYEESTSTPSTAPAPTAGTSSIFTDESTILWVVTPTKLAAFDSSLAQQCSLTPSDVVSAGRAASDGDGSALIVGRRLLTGSGNVLELYASDGTLLDSIAKASLPATSGRTVQSAAGLVSPTGTIFVAGIERTATAFYRRYWQTGVSSGAFTSISGNTVGSAPAANLGYNATLGRSGPVNSTHLIQRSISSSPYFAQYQECIDAATLSQVWATTPTYTGDTQHLLGLNSTHAFLCNTITSVISAYVLTTGSVAWTLDVSASTNLSAFSFSRFLSGGLMAVVTPSAPVAIIDLGTNSLTTTIDVGGYDLVESPAGLWIVVGPERTTDT